MRKEVLIMPQNYTPEFKKKIVRLHEEEGRTYKSITAEYGVSKASISKWCSQLREECQTSPETKEEYDYMKERLSAYRKTTVSRRIFACLSTYLLFLSDLPLHGNNIRFRAVLYKSQDVIHQAVCLSGMSHYSRHANHNRLMDILLSCFSCRYGISASYLSQQAFYHHSLFL